jgi:hypothetical protein
MASRRSALVDRQPYMESALDRPMWINMMALGGEDRAPPNVI